MQNLLGVDHRKRNAMSIVERPLPDRNKNAQVSLSAFSFLFAETIHYSYRTVGVSAVNRRLADIGYQIGVRMLEYIPWRQKATKREVKIVRFLQFISNDVWKTLFGQPAILEKSTDKKEQYMITEDTTLINQFIGGVQKEVQGLNTASLVGGIVEGLLDGGDFTARVTTHSVENEYSPQPKTIVLIEFTQEVMDREENVS
eukprot:TRINITY_DN751_c0_g2_i1.p1 TRINITY_DN751_c0_g2~~TRINITY_DN751_c0_g2_i1.p1  ORF type:complete len:232 (-),score=52.95 TRINITY_DN751_c0_g2_i1:64-663(-)